MSSTARSSNGKQFVIYANPGSLNEMSDLFDDSKCNMAKATNFAELSKLRENLGNSAINIVYMQQDKESPLGDPIVPRSNSHLHSFD